VRVWREWREPQYHPREDDTTTSFAARQSSPAAGDDESTASGTVGPTAAAAPTRRDVTTNDEPAPAPLSTVGSPPHPAGEAAAPGNHSHVPGSACERQSAATGVRGGGRGEWT